MLTQNLLVVFLLTLRRMDTLSLDMADLLAAQGVVVLHLLETLFRRVTGTSVGCLLTIQATVDLEARYPRKRHLSTAGKSLSTDRRLVFRIHLPDSLISLSFATFKYHHLLVASVVQPLLFCCRFCSITTATSYSNSKTKKCLLPSCLPCSISTLTSLGDDPPMLQSYEITETETGPLETLTFSRPLYWSEIADPCRCAGTSCCMVMVGVDESIHVGCKYLHKLAWPSIARQSLVDDTTQHNAFLPLSAVTSRCDQSRVCHWLRLVRNEDIAVYTC
ncbi:hypothetical protein CALCODRAFT_65848 [Calocera cornea HHB12733]|uniref:Post-SET domain-containing protein n=1 Tax=Calocera cornea HHB12733 TaxID=1353952 RepID=A0A165DJL5_9BASI|nr:hypothetical protein CALCODRAFT_65848 [Calocera cornea HHB12733]